MSAACAKPTACVHRNNLLIEPWKAALIFGDQLRIKARLAIPRDVNLQLPRIGHHGLAPIAVAVVARSTCARKMMVHLGIQRTFGQSFLQRIEKPALIEGSIGVAASQKLIKQCVRYRWFLAS